MTTFGRIVEQNGELLQNFCEEDFHQTVQKISEQDLQKRLAELVAEPLELHGGRLFRFNLLQTEKAKYLLRTTHHVAFDRSAANIFLADVAKFYENLDAKITAESYDALDAANDE